MIPEEVKKKIETAFPVMYADLDRHEYQRQGAEFGYKLSNEEIKKLKERIDQLNHIINHLTNSFE